jgi:hypothetical protein
MNLMKLAGSDNPASVTTAALASGALGAVVGGAVSAVNSSYRLVKGDLSGSEAFSRVVRETVGTGLSSAAAGTTVAALRVGGFLGLAGFMIGTLLAKGILDSAYAAALKKNGVYI